MSNIDEEIERLRQTVSNVSKIIDISDLDETDQPIINKRRIKLENTPYKQSYPIIDSDLLRSVDNTEQKRHHNTLPHGKYKEASNDLMRYSQCEDIDQTINYHTPTRSFKLLKTNQTKFVKNEVPFKTYKKSKDNESEGIEEVNMSEKLSPIAVSILVIIILYVMIKIEYSYYQ